MGLLLYSTEGSFQKVLNQLWCTSVPNKSVFQESVLEEATALLNEPNGLVKLFKYAHLFDEAGVFAGKPWRTFAISILLLLEVHYMRRNYGHC